MSLVYEKFDEWVIGCYVLTNTSAEKIYYVSRGNVENSVYVYTVSDYDSEEFTLYNHYYNVGVARTNEDREYRDEEGSLSPDQVSEADNDGNETST